MLIAVVRGFDITFFDIFPVGENTVIQNILLDILSSFYLTY